MERHKTLWRANSEQGGETECCWDTPGLVRVRRLARNRKRNCDGEKCGKKSCVLLGCCCVPLGREGVFLLRSAACVFREVVVFCFGRLAVCSLVGGRLRRLSVRVFRGRGFRALVERSGGPWRPQHDDMPFFVFRCEVHSWHLSV